MAEQLIHLGGDPAVRMHAVRDRADRHLVDGHARPEPVEHLAADLAVQFGDAVGARREAQAHHGHVEAGLLRLVVAMAERHQLIERDAQLGHEPTEIFLDQLAWEAIDAGRNGGVGGEHAACTRGLDGFGEGEAAGDELADPLEREEAGVALVGVEDLRREAERAERPDTGNTEHHLLA